MAEQLTSPAVIALDVGGSSIKSGVVRPGTPPRVSDHRQTELDHNAPAELLLETLAAIIRHHLPAAEPLHGVAFGIPSPFDYANGISHMTHKYAALAGVDLRGALRMALARPDLPLAFRNDAEAAIIGEVLYGSGRPYRRLLGITLGTGLGATFVADGRPILDGPTVPPGGELWHVALPTGTTADDQFSTRGILRRLRAVDATIDSAATGAARARAGDPAVQQAFSAFGDALGRFLLPYVSRFDAHALLVLGGIGRALDLFGPAIAMHLNCPLHAGDLGLDAALLGAAALL